MNGESVALNDELALITGTGLVEYDEDSQSDSDNQAASSSKIKLGMNPQISQVIIRRPTAHKVQTRAHLSNEIETLRPSEDVNTGSPMVVDGLSLPQSTPEPMLDEISRIRSLLFPPPIPDVDDWDIPPASTGSPDPAIATKLAQFSALKIDPINPKHFNDSLMSNRSFRNPHLYTKLVEFVDVDERVTNFPRDIWIPDDFQPDWYADQI
ncbi:hypothetical protein C0991_010116, partial [Blastosporella zonata]